MKTHHVIFTGLTILILWNMLLPGYIFSLDMIPPRQLDAENYIYNVYSSTNSNTPFYIILSLINTIIPFWLIQKILLFLALFLSFTTMYALIPTKSHIPKYFGAFLYALNPFVYVRFLAGHINLLLAYSITPLAVLMIFQFAEQPNRKNTIMTALMIALVGILNLHNLFLTLLLFFAILAVRLKKKHIVPALKIIFLLLLLNIYWLAPQSGGSSIDVIGTDDVSVFQSRAILNYNTIFTVASMHGFWRAGYDYSKNHITHWQILFIIIIFLSIHGYLHAKDRYRHAFAFVWMISVILATGVTTEYYREIYMFLYENLFFFKGFREPQKFIGLVVLTYAYLGSLGIDRIIKTKMRFVNIILIVLLLVPFIYSYKMFFGFGGHYASQDYPTDYYEIDAYLTNDTDDFNVLILPWHMYMDFGWNKNRDRRLAAPMHVFIGKNVITGDNMEAGSIYTSSKNPRSKYIESILKQKNMTDLGTKLIPLNVKYIILLKEVDYRNYLFVGNQSDMALVKNTSNLLLFKNTNPTHRVYQADDLQGTSISALEYEKISPLKYKISRPDKRYVILTEPHSNSWVLDSSTHVEDYYVNAFDYNSGEEILNKSSHLLFISYFISLVTLVCMLIVLIKLRNR